MNHARLFYNDTPEFIPVPTELIHRKTEVIFLPLDEEQSPSTPQQRPSGLAKDKSQPLLDEFFLSMEIIEKPRTLLELMGTAKGCFRNAEEVDTFIRAERDAWED
jgi:hypothetical protein